MWEFMTSVSVIGWIFIFLLIVGLISLPRYLREALRGGQKDPRDTLPLRSDGRPDHPPPPPNMGGGG